MDIKLQIQVKHQRDTVKVKSTCPSADSPWSLVRGIYDSLKLLGGSASLYHAAAVPEKSLEETSLCIAQLGFILAEGHSILYTDLPVWSSLYSADRKRG